MLEIKFENGGRTELYITGISIVKNEEDVIESFLRYNLKIMDHIYIIDNGSADGTVDIINALINEGFPVSLIINPGEFNQIKMTNDLLLRVVSGEFGIIPSIIIPIDADEFLISSNPDVNPRDIIEDLSRDGIHMIRWMNFIPQTIECSDIFVPYTMSSSRADQYEEVEKLIIPRDVIGEGFVLNNGNHDVFAPYELNKYKCVDLRMAHYPIRNKEQFLLKNILGYYNRLATKNYVKGRSRHIENVYYSLKNGDNDVFDLMVDFARNYCMTEVPSYAIQSNSEMFKWCEVIQLQYNCLKKHNVRSLFLSEVEEIINRYRESFLNCAETKGLSSDNGSDVFIERYSFIKMRIERIKRDYYQHKSSLLEVWINLINKGVDCGELINKYIVDKTLIFGDFPLFYKYINNEKVYVVKTDGSSYGMNFSMIRMLENVPWNDVKQVIVCDPTRIEELHSIVGSHGIDRIIELKEILERCY